MTGSIDKKPLTESDEHGEEKEADGGCCHCTAQKCCVRTLAVLLCILLVPVLLVLVIVAAVVWLVLLPLRCCCPCCNPCLEGLSDFLKWLSKLPYKAIRWICGHGFHDEPEDIEKAKIADDAESNKSYGSQEAEPEKKEEEEKK